MSQIDNASSQTFHNRDSITSFKVLSLSNLKVILYMRKTP